MKKCLLGICTALFFVGASLLLPLSPAPVAYASSGSNQTVGDDGLTDYEREQQNLPLLQRDNLIAEPKLLLAAVVLLTWFVWKMRRDIRKIKADNELFDRQRQEAERMLAELEAAEEEESEEDEAEENTLLDDASPAPTDTPPSDPTPSDSLDPSEPTAPLPEEESRLEENPDEKKETL